MNHRVSFRGTGVEYFNIWIVNTLLKAITLSVYSAWAKVRKRRYFAGKIFLDNESFEYLADPLALFRGWLIAAAAIVLYTIVSRFSPRLAIVLMFALTALSPWVVVRSRIFNSRNTAYKNIRFNFAPNYGEAYLVFLGLWGLVPFTLGILIPYVFYRQKRFLMENTSYGTTPFRFRAEPWEFYKLFLIAFLLLLCSGILIPVVNAVFTLCFGKKMWWFIPLFVATAYFVLFVYVKTAMTNLVWNRTELGGLRFSSSMESLTVFWLYLSGGVATICSLGFLFPWASVRLMRYRCACMMVRSQEGIGQFVADTASASTGAAGEEIGDLFGLDVDFGF